MDNKSATLMDEDISLLTTTWLPGPEEANAIKTRTIARQEMIEVIDQEIAVLQARRHALVRACDIGRAIVAPIRKLPVEILTNIFLKCIPVFQTKGSRWKESQVHPQDVGEVLGTVCRAWHTILQEDPRVWSTLVLDREIRAPEHVNRLLEKSKSHPLDIFIEPGLWYPTDGQEAHHDAIFAMLRSQLWRTRSFIADMRSSPENAIFPQGFSINAPIMNKFSHICNSTSPVGHDLDTFHGPGLYSITLRHSQNLVQSLVANPTSMQTVRHLEVKFSRGLTALYLQLLSILPNLVSLDWKGKDNSEQIQETIIGLNSLKSLRLHANESAMDMLPCLRAPSLESLELLFASDAVSIMQTICGNGMVKLRHLHLHRCSLSQFGISGWDTAILGELDCLETLIVEHSMRLDALLTSLSPQHRDFGSVCPQLTTFVILKSEIPLGPFVDLVLRRTRADWEEEIPGLLPSLKIREDDSPGGWSRNSSLSLCRHFTQTHSETIQIISEEEYKETSLAYILQDDQWET